MLLKLSSRMIIGISPLPVHSDRAVVKYANDRIWGIWYFLLILYFDNEHMIHKVHAQLTEGMRDRRPTIPKVRETEKSEP